MFSRFLPLLLLLGLAGCAAYKELTPDPPLTSAERGYVELRADDELFNLERDTKYVIKFPRPSQHQFYLVLVTNKKWAISAILTNRFDGDAPFPAIPDQSAGNDTVYVYPIDTSSASYAWVIDTVRSDIELSMLYRYVPRWRYTFETRYTQFVETLSENRADRTTFNAIDADFNFRSVNFGEEAATLDVRGRNLRSLNQELIAMESLFPPDIAKSRDTAYVQYRTLRSDVEDELAFQDDYRAVLDVFEKERSTGGSAELFLASASDFAAFLADQKRFPPRITDRARSMFLSRLNEAFPYYDAQLRAKRDASRIELSPPLQPVLALYGACGRQVPGDLAMLNQFVERYNLEAGALRTAQNTLRRLETLAQQPENWSRDTLFADLIASAQQAGASLPVSALDRYPGFASYPCALQLRAGLSAATAQAAAAQSLYQSSRAFLANLNSGSWIVAETILRDLHTGGQFAAAPSVDTQKRALVAHFEGEMFNRVRTMSRQRVNEFVAAHDTTLDNISTLYANPAFSPVYDITFSSGGQTELLRKKKEIQDYLDQKKYNQLPESAITTIYGSLSSSVNVRGVEKARAIVEHGKMYRGANNDVKRMIDECDPSTPKWIVRPKEYRRILALPVNPNREAQNEYLVRVRLQIPSEAQFPVFDITVRLPKEVAENATTTQWYESITINDTPIKNEGRFRITTPTSDNGYESLITPVQMDKDGRNILEIRFRHPTFRVFEISTMAQVPIIRKN